MKTRVDRTLLLLVLLLVIGSLSFAQDGSYPPPCSAGTFGRTLGRDGKTMLHGIVSAPRNAIRPKNLAWELPVGAAIGALIATNADKDALNNISNSSTTQSHWGMVSDVAIAAELGAGAIGWLGGCKSDHPSVANASFTALAAAGFGQVINLGAKEAFRRQYPYRADHTGDFFYSGRAGSFPSGHATTSFAFAAAIAHKYPHKPWIVWGSYALATGISAARIPAKKHFPSDVLVGAAIGYATGTWMANHTP